jgi:hypothetical protein
LGLGYPQISAFYLLSSLQNGPIYGPPSYNASVKKIQLYNTSISDELETPLTRKEFKGLIIFMNFDDLETRPFVFKYIFIYPKVNM